MQPNILMADPQKPPPKSSIHFFSRNSISYKIHVYTLSCFQVITYTINPTLRDNDSANKQFRYLS